MIGELPTAFMIDGRRYPIRSDYRAALRVIQAFNDPELSDGEKCAVCLKVVYTVPVRREHLQQAINKAYWFIGGGDIPKRSAEDVKTLDWEHDECMIFPAINKVAGFEVRGCGYMHWFTFLGYFGEMDEGLFTTVMNIRRKRAERKPLEKWEREFVRRNKRLVDLRTAADKAAEEETEEFLKTIT